MQILPFQPEIAERMLAGTDGETIHRDSAFVQTANGYWLAWHDGIAALNRCPAKGNRPSGFRTPRPTPLVSGSKARKI